MEHLQKKLLNKVLEKYPKKSAAVNVLASLLGTGKDAIYRRLRGDSLLTPDELSIISKTFNISVDALIYGESDTFFFTFNAYSQRVNNFEDFLNPILLDLKNVQNLPNPTIYYASAEIPIFFYLFFPELFSFKMYVFGRTIWDLEYLKNRSFDFDVVPHPYHQVAQEILSIYKNIPTIDIWSTNIFDNSLNQIEYHLENGSFNNENAALILCDKMLALADHMNAMAESGYKFLPSSKTESNSGNFELYDNEMIYTNNTILTVSDLGKMVHTTFGSPNFLRTIDQPICQYTADWFESLKTKSTPISNHSEKNRNWFFNRIKRKIMACRKRVEAVLDYSEF